MKKVAQTKIMDMSYRTLIPKLVEFSTAKLTAEDGRNARVFAFRLRGQWYTGFAV